MAAAIGMRQRLLDEALRLTQIHGYNGFSYADIADLVGIRKASIHHHFPTKGDLALALIGQFRDASREALAAIDARPGRPLARLAAYGRIFQQAIEDGNRMCLCGMLSAEQAGLPDGVRVALVEAIADHERWLAGVIRAGQRAGEIRADMTAVRLAAWVFSTLEGALLLARVAGGPARFRSVSKTLLEGIAVPPPAG